MKDTESEAGQRQMQSNLTELEELVKKHNGQGGILVLFTDDGFVESHTYGKTKKQCKVLGRWWSVSFDHIFTKIPFATVFGWGNGGVPQKISLKEWESLSPMGQSWVKALGVVSGYDDFDLETTNA